MSTTTSADHTDGVGAGAGVNDSILRPRPRKAVNAHLSYISGISDSNGNLEPFAHGHGSGSVNGGSTGANR